MNKFNFNSTDEFKDLGAGPNKTTHSKFEYDLFDEAAAAIKDDVVRVKRVSLPNHGVNWKITLNNKLLFLVEGIKLSKKEKEYFQTADGFNFLIKHARLGIKSLNALRVELKKNLP